jgi:hypothetical protein
MEALQAYAGIVGALCCVGMYAAVSIGRISADKPAFYAVNGVGSLFILSGAAHNFDIGDAGAIGQELIWAIISLFGMGRAFLKTRLANTAISPSFF